MSPSGGDTTVVLHPITWSPGNSTPCSANGEAHVVRRVAGVCTPVIVHPGPDAASSPSAMRTSGSNARSTDSSTFTPAISSALVGLRRWVGAEGDGRRARLLLQPRRQRRVVAVAVGDADGRDALAGERRGQGVAVAVEQRSGVDDGDLALAHDVRAGAPVGELRRVLGDDPAQHRRDPVDPPVDDVVERLKSGPFTDTDQRAHVADRHAVAEHRLGTASAPTSTPSDRSAATVTGVRARPPPSATLTATARPSGRAATCTPSAPSLTIRPGTDASGSTRRARPADHLGVRRHRPVHGVTLDGELAHGPRPGRAA